MNNFDPAALECLAALADAGSFERAAQQLSITQSAVSQRLRTLESRVGTVLLVRTRPLRLTTAGQLLLKHTKMLRLIRADRVMARRCAAFSKPPSSITAAKHSRAMGSKLFMVGEPEVRY